MAYGITVKALDSAGGVQLAGGQSTFTIQGQPVVLLGDPVQPHDLKNDNKKHRNNPTMVEGSKWFTWNGKNVVVETCAASCGHKTTGRPWLTLPK